MESNYSVSSKQIEDLLHEKANIELDYTIDCYSEALRQKIKKGADKSNPLAREIVNTRCKNLGAVAVVNGKELFAKLADHCKEHFGVSLNIRKIIRESRSDEISGEIVKFIHEVTCMEDPAIK